MTTQPACLVSNSHPELFHYTSETGLFGILNSQCLWATHWQHLNDSGEFLHLREELPKLIYPVLENFLQKQALEVANYEQMILDEGGIDVVCTKLGQELVHCMYQTLLKSNPKDQLFEFYITSFCTPEGDYAEVRNHGLLSQWRYYGQTGGYALVFDTAQLESLMEHEHSRWPCMLTLGEIGYSSTPKEVLLRNLEALPELQNAIAQWVAHLDSSMATENLLQPFINCCARFKHWAFAEEREVRLFAVLNGPQMIVEGDPAIERNRHSFQRNEVNVPCLHLFEGIETGRSCRLPIRRIIVGPGTDQGEREAKLLHFLQESGYFIPVTRSNIPLRF